MTSLTNLSVICKTNSRKDIKIEENILGGCLTGRVRDGNGRGCPETRWMEQRTEGGERP